ncbi:FAD-dependent monooxygenase [Myxococcota bacterium]|nr:FAD-dependent monooxygenase [Myxococcota bacterium]
MPTALIVGAGPAGAALAYLLAHRGIEVTLLERQLDFSREFRGEILMPSGVLAIEEMGLGDAMNSVSSVDQKSISLYLNASLVFRQELGSDALESVPVRAISQPQFLEMLVTEAGKSPCFRLERGTSVKGLLFEDGRVVGVRARTRAGEKSFKADLVVGADGRASAVRRHGGFTDRHASPPIDVVWWKIPCPNDWNGPCAFIGKGHLMLLYQSWDGNLQIAWIIIKGSFRELKQRSPGDWAREMAAQVSPEISSHLEACKDKLQHPFLLDSVSDCVDSWSVPGALLIGDAAHTMSPVGAQGVNIALRDTIVATNHLVPALFSEDTAILDRALRAIEEERAPEVNHIQRLQGLPPRVVMSSAWWSEPVRKLLAKILVHPGVRVRAANHVTGFAFGVADVSLEV